MKKRIQIRIAYAIRLLPLVLLLPLPAALQAQFFLVTNNGAITIAGYSGPGGDVIIPDSTNQMPVVGIENQAFQGKSSVTSVTIPYSITNIGSIPFNYCFGLTNIIVDAANAYYSSANGALFDKDQTTLIEYPTAKAGEYLIPGSVTNIGWLAFGGCPNLSNVIIPNSVISIGNSAFSGCDGLTSVILPDSVTQIAGEAFQYCSNLTNIVIGYGVTNIGGSAFQHSANLTSVFFRGNKPTIGSPFSGDNKVTLYYLPGTTNWVATIGGRPTAIWQPQMQTSDTNFGVRTNQFGFNISWANGMAVAVDACTNLANPIWSPLQTNTLTGDTLYFSDPQCMNYPTRFYRLRWP